MPSQVRHGLGTSLDPTKWGQLPPATQTILALAVFVIAVAAALSMVLSVVLWVVKVH